MSTMDLLAKARSLKELEALISEAQAELDGIKDELESCFKKKYAPDYEFSENLTELVWGNIRNAFEVGFNTAVQLFVGGGMR